MITCDIIGATSSNPGLGNQLFIIATTLSLALDNNTTAVFPDLLYPPYTFYGNTIFSQLDPGADKAFVRHVHQEEPYTSTIYNKVPYKEGMILRGHFQSYKYFYHNIDHIRKLFRLPQFMTDSIDQKYRDILQLPNTVSLHVRRGDYVALTENYATLTDEYYEAALSRIENFSKIIVFSDDISWCKENLLQNRKKDLIFIENEMDVMSIYLMSKMKNNIVANSTFSLWGAFLNENENATIVAPRPWFGPGRTADNDRETADLIPPHWMRI